MYFKMSQVYPSQGFIWGQIFGGEPTHQFIRMYIYTRAAPRGTTRRTLFNGIKNPTHARSMHIRFPYRIMMKTKQWQIIVMYVMGTDMYVE